VNDPVVIGALTALFGGIVGLMKYLLNQKDTRIKELEAKNQKLVDQLIKKSRGNKK
jgi:hypothetical protein